MGLEWSNHSNLSPMSSTNHLWHLHLSQTPIPQHWTILLPIKTHKNTPLIQQLQMSWTLLGSIISKTPLYLFLPTHILYINSFSLSVCRGLETQITFNKIVPPNSRAQKLFRTSSSYFLFLRFRVATAVVDGGGIFGIWRVGEEIWMRFFWAKGLGGSWFLFFSWRGEGVGVGF
jgi:hypothetical protein